jgi:protoporphyrinogen oxidase
MGTDGSSLQTFQNKADISAGKEREALAQVVVLGAGPAGLGAAFQLARRRARAIVLEQQEGPGGNAGSFQIDGTYVDYGSHRLHPSCDPEILRDLRELLGDDLLDRPRHGRILLEGRWIHFPLKPLDLLLRLPKNFAFGVAADALHKNGRAPQGGTDTFASVLERGLGRTICQKFYFPYARKLWGLSPDELAATQARRRVSGNSLGKMLRKVAAAVPGLKPPGAGRFFYPRQGYGEIAQQLHAAATNAGAEFVFGARVTTIEREGNRVTAVRDQREGQEHRIPTANVWSTLPLTVLVRVIQPAAPAEVLEAATSISFRGMILIYLVLEQDRFSEYDAHYFPDSALPLSRLSEPKNYSGTSEPRGRTVLCAELPADPGSREWEICDDELGKALCGWLAQAGLPVRAPVRQVVTRRLRQAYPVYRRGYEAHFAKMDQWLGGIEGLLSFGRQGLFAHDNTHHALYMAYAAVKCFGSDGNFDGARWREFRQVFETHIVED